VNFAPVLYPDDFARTDWPGALGALGALFDRQDEAASAIADYERMIEQGRERLAPIAGATFAPVNGFGADGAGIIDEGQLITQVAADLGLTPHALVAADPATRTILSLEELGRLDDVDFLLFARFPSEDSTERESEFAGPVLDSPIWLQLPAVVEGRQIDYPAELYYASPITAVGLAAHLVDALAATIG
jgi:ABC-type Fe3+-hydroxamate transport system substrate-binding protein